MIEDQTNGVSPLVSCASFLTSECCLTGPVVPKNSVIHSQGTTTGLQHYVSSFVFTGQAFHCTWRIAMVDGTPRDLAPCFDFGVDSSKSLAVSTCFLLRFSSLLGLVCSLLMSSLSFTNMQRKFSALRLGSSLSVLLSKDFVTGTKPDSFPVLDILPV